MTGYNNAVYDSLEEAAKQDCVYLLHFLEPYPAGKHPQHYLGHATEGRLELRMAEHKKGTNKARFTQVMAELGIEFIVARVWQGDYALERELKRRKRPRSLCPICTLGTGLLVQPPGTVAPRDRRVCSSCNKPGEWSSFDASGRCVECQP